MISRTARHAAAAVIALAELPSGAYAGAGEIADKIKAPRNYLGKLLKVLADEEVVESQKGKGGGFRLAKDPAGISLFDVVEPIDHVSRWGGCLLGRSRCSDQSPCAVHFRWSGVRDVYLKFLKETSIADLVEQPELQTNVT
jgi:Rrf2 family protein